MTITCCYYCNKIAMVIHNNVPVCVYHAPKSKLSDKAKCLCEIACEPPGGRIQRPGCPVHLPFDKPVS